MHDRKAMKMKDYAHQAAIDQANLISVYLSNTPPSNIDLCFIRRHLNEIAIYAEEALNYSHISDNSANKVHEGKTRPDWRLIPQADNTICAIITDEKLRLFFSHTYDY